MLSIEDLLGNEEPLTDFKSLKRIRRVNGESTISALFLPSKRNEHAFNLISEESTVHFEHEYIIKKIQEKSIGKKSYKQIDAVHKFYIDLINKQQPKIHNGSITFNNYMNMVFEDTGYSFVVLDVFNSRPFENLGNENRLSLLQKGLQRFKAEFELVGNEVRFQEIIGNDTDFQFRFGHNIKAISVDVDSTNLATVIRGTGDKELGVEAYYRSPNADIVGELDSPPVNDERFKSEEALLDEMKLRLQDEPEVSIQIDFVDLRAAGYPYTVPNEGDRVWVIYEPMNDLLLETRILEIEEHFDNELKVTKTNVTLSNHRRSFADTMFENVNKRLSEIINDDGIIKYDVLDQAVKLATEALQSAQTELIFDNGIIAREKTDPNKLVLFNSAGIGISSDGGQTFSTAMTGDGIVADVITAGTIRGIDIIGTNIMSYNSVTNDVITLENGIIETFTNGKKRFSVHGDGLTAYHWDTEEPIATFRATHVNSERFGAGIMGEGDYFSIGKNIGDDVERSQLAFYWDEDYDRTVLYGGVGIRDSGMVTIQATQSGGSAGGNVPHLEVDNRTVDGVSYSGARFYVGRDNRSPANNAFRSGFEVWQYSGNGNGGMNQLLKIDTDANGDKYVHAFVDDFYIGGSLDLNQGIVTGGTSDFYGHLDMNEWNIEGVGDFSLSNRLNFNYERGWRFGQLNSGAATSLGLISTHGLKSFKVTDPELYDVLDVRVGSNGDQGRVEVFGNFHVTGSKNALVQTENYGKRLMYADESTGSFFNTRIHKQALPIGKHTIEINKMFLETVSDYIALPFVRNGSEVRILEENEFSFNVEVIGKVADVVFYISGTRKGFEGVYMEEFSDEVESETPMMAKSTMKKHSNKALVKPVKNTIKDAANIENESRVLNGPEKN